MNSWITSSRSRGMAWLVARLSATARDAAMYCGRDRSIAAIRSAPKKRITDSSSWTWTIVGIPSGARRSKTSLTAIVL